MLRVGYGLMVGAAIGAHAAAGPEWMEMGDAGRTPAQAQPVTGNGSGVLIISGRLGGTGLVNGVGDFHDVYLIRIDDPESFRATTLVEFEGFAAFDAELFLFQADGPEGFGLLANLDASAATTDPLITPMATDGSQASIQEPGLYYLAISGKPAVPISFDGPIFNFASQTEVSGPDGNGGFNAFSDWLSDGETGDYKVGLRGVVSIPISEIGCDPADIAPPYGVHDMTDVLLFLSEFSGGVLDLTDLAPPMGSLDFSDVVAFLLEFADGC